MTTALLTLRGELRQLADRHRNGTLADEAYEVARVPLERALVDLLVAAPASAFEQRPRASRRLVTALVAGIAVVAVAGYLVTGNPGMLLLNPAPAAVASTDGSDVTEAAAREQIAKMVDALAARLAAKPDDAEGWQMLARSYAALGRGADAVAAYGRAIALRGEDANLLADSADAVAMQNDGRPNAQSDALVARALAADPANPKALALAGTSAFEHGDYATAVKHWERMAQLLPPDSADAPRLQASIAEARQRGGLAAATTTSSAVSPATPVAVGAATVSGTVTLAPALAARADPEATVFVTARAVTGPRMPLAVLRVKAKDLPLAFTLDDSMAMAPEAKLSKFGQVIVTARISQHGDALPRAGDLTGSTQPVAPGSRDLGIRIDQVVTE